MNQTDIHNKRTNRAWELLHARLENDGLLADYPAKKPLIENRKQATSWVLAAASLITAVFTVFHLLAPADPKQSLLTMVNTEDATTLITTLEDGSIVFLEEKSALFYPEQFEPEKREVVLEGNAQFEVSGNRERPFLIDTKEVQIEVLGTSFEISNEDNNPFELTVTTGVVKVTSKKDNHSRRVKAGEKVRLLSDGLQLSQVDNNSAIRSSENQTRYLRFKDEKLGDILRVLNKRMHGTLLSLDPSLIDKSFTVSFESQTSAEEIAEVICVALGLRYSKENNTIRLMN